jgi:hypothetical protein
MSACAHPLSPISMAPFHLFRLCTWMRPPTPPYMGKQSKSRWKIKSASAHSARASIALFVSERFPCMRWRRASERAPWEMMIIITTHDFLQPPARNLREIASQRFLLFESAVALVVNWIRSASSLTPLFIISGAAASALFAQFFFLVSFPHKTAHS